MLLGIYKCTFLVCLSLFWPRQYSSNMSRVLLIKCRVSLMVWVEPQNQTLLEWKIFISFFAGCLKRRVLSFILLLASLVAILFSFRSVVFSPHPRVVVSGERYGSTSRPDIDTLTQTLTVRLSGMLDTSPFIFIYFNIYYPSHLLCFACKYPEICDRCLVYSLMFTMYVCACVVSTFIARLLISFLWFSSLFF